MDIKCKPGREIPELSKKSIKSKTSRKEIPFSKRGRHLYFFKADLINWLKTGKYKTNDEIEMEAQEQILKRKHPLAHNTY